MNHRNTHLSSVDAITSLLFVEDAPQAADLVFVFGSDWLPTMDPAIDLYNRKLVPHILITGASYVGKERHITESEEFANYAIQKGVPKKAIILEDKATNTLENMKFARDLIDQQLGWSNVKRVIFVCKSFHARRVLMTAAKNWPSGKELLCIPVVDERGIRATDWWKHEIPRKRVLEELRRISDYTLKGDIGDF